MEAMMLVSDERALTDAELRASDPTASGEELQRLKERYPHLVAANPAAPIKLLGALAEEFPNVVAGNPAVTLGLITGESIFDSVRVLDAPMLLASPNATEALLEAAADWFRSKGRYWTREVIQGFLANPVTPARTLVELEELARDRKKGVPVAYVRRHRNYPKPVVPRDTQRELEQALERVEIDSITWATTVFQGTVVPTWVQVQLVKRNASFLGSLPSVSDEALDLVIEEAPEKVLTRIIQRDDLGEWQYYNLVERLKGSTPVMLQALRNPFLPTSAVGRLARILGPSLGLAALTHPNMTDDELSSLEVSSRAFSRDKIAEAREVVREPRAAKPRATPEPRWRSAATLHQLRQLIAARRYDLLTVVALDPGLHSRFAVELARLPDVGVRLALAHNPNLTGRAREILQGDADLLVARAARA